MEAKITIKQIIEIVDGPLLTPEKVAAIKAIINDEVDPPEEVKCKAGPTPLSVKALSENKLDVAWHGDEVTPLRYEVSDLIGNVNGAATVVPKPEDQGHLKITLDSPMYSSPQYRVQLFGVNCEGSGLLVFDNPYYKPPVENLCKVAPKPLEIKKIGDKQLDVAWYGEEVKELKLKVYDDDNNLGGEGIFQPTAAQRGHLTLTLTNTLSSKKQIAVAMNGISCDGGNVAIFDNPFFFEEPGEECCKGKLTINSLEVNQKDE